MAADCTVDIVNSSDHQIFGLQAMCLNPITLPIGGAVWVHASASVTDNIGAPLPQPDTLNDHIENTPDDVFYEM